MKKSLRKKISLGISLFVGVTFGYFTWLTWERLTLLIGNSNLVWGITGGIVLLAVVSGYFGINKIIERFT